MKITQHSTIGIIGGKGRTGRQFARLFKSAGLRVLVTGSRDTHRNVSLLASCDIIVFSLPLSRAAGIITDLMPHATRIDQLLLDLSSLKEREVQAMLAGAGEVIGMHPLFGPFTDPRGEKVILCPARATSATVRSVRAFFKTAQVGTTLMSTKEHDELMATVQAIPHLKSLLVADTLRMGKADLQHTLSLCTPIYEHEFNIVGRFLDDHPDLYVPIIFRNPRILPVLRNMRKSIDDYIAIAEAKNYQKAEARYADCKTYFKPFLKRARQRSELCVRALLSASRHSV